MKKTITALFMLLSLGAAAQTTPEDYSAKYNRLTAMVGPAGVGIETHIDKWEAAFPEDVDMLKAKALFWFTRSERSEIVAKNQKKFMGNEPVLALKDTLGNDVFYFQEMLHDEEMFGECIKALDKAIRLNSRRLDLQCEKLNALAAFEKEDPAMFMDELNGIIDYNYSSKPEWIFDGKKVDNELFESIVEEYCLQLYTIGSDRTLDAFRSVSEKMLKYSPKSVTFIDNLGSYEFVVKNNSKAALKRYNKALKIDPKDYTAIKNSILIARRDKDTKLEKKYLPMLVKYGQTDLEKEAAQARLDALKGKKK